LTGLLLRVGVVVVTTEVVAVVLVDLELAQDYQ
jgi:hypothetical protein